MALSLGVIKLPRVHLSSFRRCLHLESQSSQPLISSRGSLFLHPPSPSSTSFASLQLCLPHVLRRNMAGARLFVIHPTRYGWRRFKSSMHFFILLGVLPLTAFTFYQNVFIGRAELAEIPEGYYPEEYEYYKHPVERFFAKYLADPPQKFYEQQLAVISDELDKARLKRLELKIEALQQERRDYQGYHWLPSQPTYYQKQWRDYFNRHEEEANVALRPSGAK